MDIIDARIAQIRVAGEREGFVAASNSSPITAEPAVKTVPLDRLARRISETIYQPLGQAELDQILDRRLRLDPRAQRGEISRVLDVLDDGLFSRNVGHQDRAGV